MCINNERHNSIPQLMEHLKVAKIPFFVCVLSQQNKKFETIEAIFHWQSAQMAPLL